ncbi:MAG TPA: hypothetical protein VIL89_09970 [Clostridia bacterium]
MKLISKKVVVITLTAILLCSLVSGCVAPETQGSDSKGSDTQTTQEEVVKKTGLPVANKPITLEIMVRKHPNDKSSSWSDKPCVKKAEEETGLKLEWNEILQTAWKEQVSVILNSRQYPDVIVGDIEGFSLFKDCFIPLNDLIDEYAPTAVKFFEKYPELKVAVTYLDRNIYFLPQYQATGINGHGSFGINKTWLDNLSLEIPETIDDLYNVLKAFRENDPNQNNQKDEIPYGFFLEQSYHGYHSLDVIIWNFGLVNDGLNAFHDVMVENGKVIFIPTDDRYYDFLKFMSKLYAEELLDQDGFVQNSQDFFNKGKNGLYGYFTYHAYDDIVVGVENTDDYIRILPTKDRNGNRVVQPLKVAGGFTPDFFKITTQCEYPEAAMRLWEYVNGSFENKMLWAFGTENEAWTTVNGKIQMMSNKVPEGYSSYAELRQTKATGMAGFWISDEGFNWSTPRELKRATVDEQYSPYFVKEYIPLGQDDPDVTQERNIMYTEINTYMSNFIAESIIKGIDEGKWATHLENCKKLNVDQFVADYQAYYDRIQSLMK